MQTKRALQSWFTFVTVVMLAATVWASLEKNVVRAFADLARDRWALATLLDAYFAFIAFFLWLAYKEPRWGARLGWLAFLLGFGNFAIAGYALWQLAKWDPRSGAAGLLLRPSGAKAVKASAKKTARGAGKR
jgi:hypothetical protein